MAEQKHTPARTQRTGAEVTKENQQQTQGAGDLNTTPGMVGPLESGANPEGKKDVSTGPVGDSEVIDGQEHVLGDDPRRVAHHAGGFHDSLTGRPIDEKGMFTDSTIPGSEGPVPKHRIVANNWPQEREKMDDSQKRIGNKAAE